MFVELFEPTHPSLKRHIEFFYVLQRTAEDKPETYLTFPNVYTMLSVNQYATIITNGNKITVGSNVSNRIVSSLASNYLKPLLIEYCGVANEISIGFKPLGLNAFLGKPVNDYLTNSPLTVDFSPFSDYDDCMFNILSTDNHDDKIGALEQYLLGKLNGFDHRFLYDVVDELGELDNSKLSIAGLAAKHGVTQKTLIGHFTRFTGKTPADFRKIVRFRNALQEKSWMDAERNLTEVTYLARYFDQSHMIKDFKSLTGYTPREFFKSLSAAHKGKISWIYLR